MARRSSRRRTGAAFALREAIRQAIEDSRRRARPARFPSISTSPENLEIFADPEHVLRVFENLNRNAIQALAQFGPSHGRPAGDPLRRRRASIGAALIEVSDTGPGFPPHLARRIFEPFHLSTREGGSGLGLAIAADLTDRNGGSIALAPREPDDFYCGARFRITLPAPRDRAA